MTWIFLVLTAAAPATALAADGDPIEKRTEVGPVTAIVRLEPSSPLIGDPVTFTIEVRADEGIELLMPEFGEALDRFSITDFTPTPERIESDGMIVAVQRYSLQPEFSGEQSVPPILIEFVDHRPDRKPAPDGEDAYELLTERIEFEVQSVVPEGASAELEPILDPLPPREAPPQPRWPYALAIVVAGLVALPFVVRAFLAWRRRARRRSAHDIARTQLDRLLGSGIPIDADGLGRFFVQISGIIRRYIENRFEVRAPEYTTEEFLSAVSDSPDVSVEHQQLLREFLRQADLVKFAHALPPPAEVQESVTLARRFLDETREAAPMIDESADVAAGGAASQGAAHV